MPGSARLVPVAPAPLPAWTWRPGPVTRALASRSLAVYAAVYLLGAALALGLPGAWQVLGVGLLWPGAGFLLADAGSLAWVAGLLVLLVLFPLTLVLWLGSGNAFAPPLAWGAAAVAAAGVVHAPQTLLIPVALLVPPVSALGIGLAWLAWRARGYRERRHAGQRLERSAQAWAQARIVPAQAQQAPCGPADQADLQRWRFVLDRALQPLEEFQGFEWLDQYQTAAVRYQLNFMGYALAMLQATQPAFRGYLLQGQRQLILKLADHRVWRYWASESAWGHGRLDPDPTSRDNIMYTGFSALQMALSQAASGSREWLAPDSLLLRHPQGHCFGADLPALGAALQRDLVRSPLTLMACEPNWVYPLCNTMSASALRALDAQTGEDRWQPHAGRFRQALLAEFMAPGGHFVPFRSSYTGWAAPVMGGALPAALTSFFLNALWPELALQQWLLLRDTLLAPGGSLRHGAFWSIDVGNYRRSLAAALAGTALAARELGDEEVAAACFEALDQHHPEVIQGQHRRRPGMSVWGHALEMMARCGGSGVFRRLVNEPTGTADAGPLLTQVPYHQLMVSSARPLATQRGLQAVLTPLFAGPHTLGFDGLRPGRVAQLQVEGAAQSHHVLVADAQGQATLTLPFGRCAQTVTLMNQPPAG